MRFIYILLFVLYTQSIFPQSYTADRIWYKGELHPYYYHHLEQFLKNNPNKRPVPIKEGDLANRGYIAEFTLDDKDNTLYLTNVFVEEASSNTKEKSIKQQILGKGVEKIPMYWINGLYDFGLGDPKVSPTEERPLFDNYLIIEVNRGRVTKYNTFNYKQMERFKSYQWNQFYNTTHYRRVFRLLEESGMDTDRIKDHIRYHVIFYSKRNYILQ